MTGAGDGDDEVIDINLQGLPPKIDKLIIIINIFEAHSRRQKFSMIKNCFVRLCNGKKELLRYDLEKTGKYDNSTGIHFATLERINSEWSFKAIGDTYDVADIEQLKNKILEKYKKKNIV